MNMQLVDWGILGGLVTLICVMALVSRKYTKSVADYLSANRCAGRYLLTLSEGISSLGAVSVVAFFEMYYKAGFTAIWWATMMMPVGVIVALSGWVQYRYRETRAMTMAQFFEMRYSRRFRVFAGVLAFVSGTLNFGIFPAVGGRFFQYYCGLPTHMVSMGPLSVDVVYATIVFVLLAISLSFTFLGGQIAVMVTDFFQGFFCNVVLVILVGYLLFRFDWSLVTEAFASAPADASLVNPMKTSDTDNFNITYFLVGTFGAFFTFMAWQGSQGYFSAAASPHEARMGRVLGTFRLLAQTLALVLLPVCAFAFMNHPQFAEGAQEVQGVLNTVDNPQLQSQLRVTVALTQIPPTGLLGAFAAVMFAAFVSTHDTYLHSWGAIFVQDVLLPIRATFFGDKKPLSPTTHIWCLRIAISAVAVFIFMFALFFNQRQDILMFFALTGTIFLGWAGACIVGGLYWKRGTTGGAWAAAVSGVILAVLGWYMTYYWKDCRAFCAHCAPALWAKALAWWPKLGGGDTGERCPITAQVLWGLTMLSTSVSYAGVSLLTGRGRVFNLERMLHRGQYAVESEGKTEQIPATGFRIFGGGPEFTKSDRFIFLGSYVYVFVFFGVFLVGTICALFLDISDTAWSHFWRAYCWLILTLSVGIAVWLGIGGFRDLGRLFTSLRTIKRDIRDDGTVVGHTNLDELENGDIESQ